MHVGHKHVPPPLVAQQPAKTRPKASDGLEEMYEPIRIAEDLGDGRRSRQGARQQRPRPPTVRIDSARGAAFGLEPNPAQQAAPKVVDSLVATQGGGDPVPSSADPDTLSIAELLARITAPGEK